VCRSHSSTYTPHQEFVFSISRYDATTTEDDDSHNRISSYTTTTSPAAAAAAAPAAAAAQIVGYVARSVRTMDRDV